MGNDRRSSGPVRAAGAVLWRPVGAGVEIALVHRPRYDDWSLPKGHVERGEHPAVAALREVAEETGHRATLSRFLGATGYEVGGRAKSVQYWSARAVDGEFSPNDETDELRWLPVVRARVTVTHSADTDILDGFAAMSPASSTMLLVRHAQAEPVGSGTADAQRALTAHGREQAAALVPLLLAFGASEVHAADLRRCRQTAHPVAQALGLAVIPETALPEQTYASHRAAGLGRLDTIRRSSGVPVVCSQDGVIPDALRSWAPSSALDLRTAIATTWVVSSVAGEVTALDRLSSPLG